MGYYWLPSLPYNSTLPASLAAIPSLVATLCSSLKTHPQALHDDGADDNDQTRWELEYEWTNKFSLYQKQFSLNTHRHRSRHHQFSLAQV